MAGPSILVTFVDQAELERAHDETLVNGCAVVEGRHTLEVGQVCEAVLVHPDTGESLLIDAAVDEVEPDRVRLRFEADRSDELRDFIGREPLAKNAYERVRHLSGPERRRVALTGELSDRIALERIFNKEVWEPLIRNPKLTVAEVSRLARMQTMPRPLLEEIIRNKAWLRTGEVRRALLANTRLDRGQIRQVLLMMPTHELRLVPKQTAYPQGVRTVAKTMIED